MLTTVERTEDEVLDEITRLRQALEAIRVKAELQYPEERSSFTREVAAMALYALEHAHLPHEDSTTA